MVSDQSLPRTGSGKRSLGRGNPALLPWIHFAGRAQDPRHCLEAGLGDMVVVGAVKIGHMQGDPGVLRQGLEKLADEFGVEAADFRRGEIHIPDQERPARNIDRRTGQGLVHRQIQRGVAVDASAIAQGLGQRLTYGDAGILDRMVIVDVQIAFGLDVDVHQRMTGQLFQHVVEKTYAGRDRPGAGAVDRQRHGYIGFICLAGNRRGARIFRGGHQTSPNCALALNIRPHNKYPERLWSDAVVQSRALPYEADTGPANRGWICNRARLAYIVHNTTQRGSAAA